MLNTANSDFYSVMYHYVRPLEKSNLRTLPLSNFFQQLDWIKENSRFVTRDEWLRFRNHRIAPSGALLTFDDGLKDHISYVIPELEKRGIFAIFYICTNPLEGIPLAVHIAHILLSNNPAKALLDALKAKLSIGTSSEIKEDSHKAYEKQDHSSIEKEFKLLVNWSISNHEIRPKLVEMFTEFESRDLSDFVGSWYLNRDEVRLISSKGFEIGSHSCSHNPMANLSESEIKRELEFSKSHLEDITSTSVTSFCYPYGGSWSYPRSIFPVLTDLGYTDAFSVDPSPIDPNNRESEYIFELPRYDCNQLPFGVWERL